MTKILFFIPAFFGCVHANVSGEAVFPKEIKSIGGISVKGWQISRDGIVKGQVNNDNFLDIALVLENKQENKRIFLLYLGRKAGFDLSATGKKAIYGPSDGGMMGDPFQGLSFDAKKRVFSVSMYGGSTHRWGIVYKYRYQNNGLYLIGSIHDRFWTLGGELKTLETNYMTKKYQFIVGAKKRRGGKVKSFEIPNSRPVNIENFDAFEGEKHVKNYNFKIGPQ